MEDIQAELAILQNYSDAPSIAATVVTEASVTATPVAAPPQSSQPPSLRRILDPLRRACDRPDHFRHGDVAIAIHFQGAALHPRRTFTLVVACLYEVYFVSRMRWNHREIRVQPQDCEG